MGVNVGELGCGYSALVKLDEDISVHWKVPVE